MICVESVKIIKLDRSRVEILDEYDRKISIYDPTKPKPEIRRIMETIYSRCFMNVDGQEVYIGMSKQVQEALGLPFDAFDSMSKRLRDNSDIINHLDGELASQKQTIKQHETMSFWNKIKFILEHKIF